jgi:hypothetical protein
MLNVIIAAIVLASLFWLIKTIIETFDSHWKD